MKRGVIFSVTDIVKILKQRQDNEFDANFAVAGDRGDGKSTLTNKIFYKIGKFNPWKHQVYNQDDVIKLLTTQHKGKCFDDEAINSGYKRNFQDKGQQKLIKILTNYRDNFNIYGSALPNFFSLDKDLRDLIFMLLHVIERGVAVVHLPLQGRMYSQDRWDAKNNAKIEQSWNNKVKNNMNFKIPYHKLSTFAGYLYFTDITEKQKALYKEVKRVKRAEEFQDEPQTKEQSWLENVYTQLVARKLDKDFLMRLCLLENKKFSNVTASLNTMLKDRGIKDTVSFYLSPEKPNLNINHTDQIKDLVPDLQGSST